MLLSAFGASGAGAVTHQLIWNSAVSDGTATMTAPLVPGIVVAMCLAVAVGYGVRAALGRARRGPGSGALVLPRSGSG